MVPDEEKSGPKETKVVMFVGRVVAIGCPFHA